jgi:hypothetical protein
VSRLPPRRLAPVIAVALIVTAALVPVAVSPVVAAGGSDFVSMANGYRADAGLGPVALHAAIDEIAVERGEQILRDGEIGHDFPYIERRLAEEGICWNGYGEIVAYNGSGDFDRFGEQWFNSTVHRNVMQGDYTHAGGSREEADGRWYGVMVFVKICGAPTPTLTIGGFTDIASSSFTSDILWLVDEGITAGCAADRFCPRDPVARGQMASFINRALGLPGTSDNFFTDDDDSTHHLAINRMAAASLTGGCTPSRYCPTASVTRAQMASFLDRALRLPKTSVDYFGDDDGSTHEAAINRLAEAGIASGCAADRFCPSQSVTREQMAAFLHRALGD